MHVTALNAIKKVVILIHSFQAAQVATLYQDKALIKMFTEYVDFADVFLPNLAIKLLENTSIKEHAIELIDGKQFFMGLSMP